MQAPPEALTAEEQAKIRAHLGFPVIDGRVARALGLPVSTETSYIVDSAMERVLPQGLGMVRRALNECECIDLQRSQSRRQRGPVQGVTGVQLRPRQELEDLEDEYDVWTRRLADALGVVRNPLSSGAQRGGITVIDPC